MNSEIKIPTIFGLGVLITGLIFGVFLTTGRQFLSLGTKAAQSSIPKNITVANLSATSASIFWQTDDAAPGFLQTGPTSSLGSTFRDDRDKQTPQPHQLHFVTVSGLLPETTYFYKINSGSLSYPLNNVLSFKTAPILIPSNQQPIIGNVSDSNLQPVTEVIVMLNLPGAQKLATITKVSGNFILPLNEIRTEDLNNSFNIPEAGLSATLTVFNLQKSSRVNIKLPASKPLEKPITLGQDLDLVPTIITPTPFEPNYDLNGDGVVNSLDLGILLKNYGRKPTDKKLDLNNDGIVDQKDVNLLNKVIPHTSLQ